MLKRAYLAVIRRKSKTIILGIILLVIANLVLSSITIKNATEEQEKFARESLESKVLLSVDMEKVRSEMTEKVSSGEMNAGNFQRLEMPSIYISDLNEIIGSEYISDYSFGFDNRAIAVNFDPVEVQVNDNQRNNQNQIIDDADILIKSVNAFELASDVTNDMIELIEGESFNEEDKDNVIISATLSLLNSLNVGDEIQIKPTSDDTVIKTYNIIGIYEENSDTSDNRIIDLSNTLYVNTNTGLELLSEDSYNLGDYIIENVVIYIDDPLNTTDFINESKLILTDLESRNLMLDIDTAAYEQMAGPISSVAETSSSILIFVVIASVIILSLLIINQIKDRNYEIGVLLSLGEKKSKIAIQLLMELIIIATISFSISLFTSQFISQQIGDNLLASQIENANSEDTNQRGNHGPMMRNSIQDMNVEVIDTIDVSASLEDYIVLYLVGYGIILTSLLLPIIQILKYEPKTILTRRD